MNKVGFKLVIMTGIAVLLSVLLTGGFGYISSKKIITHDVETTKMSNLVKLKAATVEKLIHSGIEISKTLAQDTTLQKWFKGNEKDDELGMLARQKLNFIAQELGYSVAFAANKNTLHFWTNGNNLTDVLSKNDPDDRWFFNFLNQRRPVEVNVEYNRDLKDLFVWINVLMGPLNEPLGIAGVGLPFKETKEEFTKHEFGEFGKVWMINEKGQIQIDEQVENIGKQVQDFIPVSVVTNLLSNPGKSSVQIYDDPNKIETILDWKQEVILAMNRIADTDSIIIIRIYITRWLWSILTPFFRGLLSSAVITLVMVSSFFALLSALNTRILTRLSQAILALGEEKFDNAALCGEDLERKDEFGDIARGYETTRGKLSVAYHNLKALNMTFERFVPKQFLNRIAKDGIEQIQLGEAECDSITILFSDIRSFTNLSENMSPQDILNFLNVYFRRMNQPIHENHGFVDKFIGDAIMALFDRPAGTDRDKAKDAVLAAIGMQEALKEYNNHRSISGYIPISIGIGIHSGEVIIGTVGSEDRMDSTVLGDTVNMASRMEGLTKYYNSQIVISSQTYRRLEDDSSFLLRELDFVSVKGRDKPEVIFEVFNSNPKEIRDLKQQTIHSYHEGLTNYRLRNWKESIQLFEKCLEVYPGDSVSKMYLERCIQFQNNPPPLGWNGVSRLLSK